MGRSPPARPRAGGRRPRAASAPAGGRWRPAANALSALGPRPGPLCASRRRPDLASSVARSGLGGLACGAEPDPSVSADQHVQGRPRADDLDQAGAVQLGQQGAGSRSWGPARPGPRAPGPRIARARTASSAAAAAAGAGTGRPRSWAGPAGWPRRGRRRGRLRAPGRRRAGPGHGQGGGPPALAPAQQRPGPARAQRRPLGQLGQLGAGRGGLSAQLRGAQGQPVRVQQARPRRHACSSRRGRSRPAPSRPARVGQQGLGQPAAARGRAGRDDYRGDGRSDGGPRPAGRAGSATRPASRCACAASTEPSRRGRRRLAGRASSGPDPRPGRSGR